MSKEIIERKRVQANVRMPVHLKEKIQKEAETKGISVNDYILLAIQEKISRQK